MINVILGKSKTGKTTHIYNMIEQDIAENLNVILFVPSQSRAKAENEYMKILNKNGVMGVNITTISEFVKEKLKLQNLHIDEKYMSKMDRKIILTQVIKENPELFNIFKKVKRFPGFLDVLDIYMDLFRKSEIDPADFSNVDIGDKRVNGKFKEILSVYDKYLEKIKTKYIDSVEEMDIFLKNIDKCGEFVNSKNTHVYFDGYNNFSNSEFRFIDILMKKNIEINITLNTDITRIEDTYISSSIFEIPNNTYIRLCKLANKNNISLENIVKYENMFNTKEDIKYIANNIFEQKNTDKISLENIELTMHTNVLKEIESVARTISKEIKNGARYSDFAIYTTNIDEYQKVISRIFYENNLEVYIAKSKKISESVLSKYIQSILNLANRGLNLELIFEILKLGLTDIDLKDIYLLENYMREFNVNKYLVEKDFYLNNISNSYDLDKLNEIKNRIVNMYTFTINMKNMTCKEIIETIYNHLENENIFNNFTILTQPIKNDIINLDMNNFEKQVWDSLVNVFDSMVKIYGEEKITIDEFNNIFELVVKDIKIKTLPPTKDQIELVDINVSKIEAKKYVFFIGVVEGKFPKKVDEDIFFTDDELEKLRAKEIDIRETTISKLNMGFYNIYEALNNISEKLYINIPSATLDGKSTRKSSFITLLEQIANFKIKGEVTKTEEVDNIYDIYSKDELFMWLIRNIRNFDNLADAKKEEVISVYEYFKKDNNYSKILEFKKDDSKLSNEVTDIVYSNEFKTSVSKLELYKKCPFSYFMQYILKVNPNKEAKVNVLELGSFMHDVLENFSKLLMTKEIKWQAILTEDLEGIKTEYEEILEEIISDSIENNLSKQKQSVRYMVLKRKLVNTMKKVIHTVALSYNQSEFEPFGYEIEFKDGSAFLPMEIEVEKGKIMKLIGKIDRVDMLEHNGENYVRVVDYKSSSKDLSIENIKEGLSLQLITYLTAFMENRKEMNIKPAGMLYFNLSDKLVSLAQYEQDNENIKKALMKKLKMNGIFVKNLEIINKMDRNYEKDNSNSLINLSKRSFEGKRTLEESEFEKLCDTTKEILKQIGRDISSGIVKIAPNKKEKYCQFCNYSTTCRKNIEV